MASLYVDVAFMTAKAAGVAASALLALFVFIQFVSNLNENYRSAKLRKRLGGKAGVRGVRFLVDGHPCRLHHNGLVVLLDIELHRQLGEFAIIGPRSIWGVEDRLTYRQSSVVNNTTYVVAAESKLVFDHITSNPGFKMLISELFREPMAMLLKTVAPGKAKTTLCFNGFPMDIYQTPDRLETLTKEILLVFDPFYGAS